MHTSRIASLIAVGTISLPLLAGTTSAVAANPRIHVAYRNAAGGTEGL